MLNDHIEQLWSVRGPADGWQECTVLDLKIKRSHLQWYKMVEETVSVEYFSWHSAIAPNGQMPVNTIDLRGHADGIMLGIVECLALKLSMAVSVLHGARIMALEHIETGKEQLEDNEENVLVAASDDWALTSVRPKCNGMIESLESADTIIRLHAGRSRCGRKDASANGCE